jgi:zinc protease
VAISDLRSFRIPSRTRTLPNGLRVVHHEDRSSPIVAVHLMYHVGSRNEPEGRTGLAHLLEHLLFEGSAHCPKGSFDTLLEHVGGTNNGSTWLDRTNYFETVPTHAAELPLWLERDRLAHFLPVLDEEMLELQRDVVINERLQTTENRPYGRADERLYQLLFRPEHPYSWPTIGWMEDLERISLGDVRGFFESYYTPSNLTLVLAGDLGTDQAFDLAERYFGDLPAGPSRNGAGRAPSDAVPADPRRDTMPDRVSFPRLYRAHATPPYGSADWNALDVLAYVLADGESSRLQRALVRDAQIALEVDTYLLPTELAGVFGITATARSGVGIEAVEDRIRSVVASLVERGVSGDELAGALRRMRRDQLATLATMEDRAEALAHAATLLGDADALNDVIAGYLEVTPDDVVRVAEQFLAGGAVLVVSPNGEAGDADE